MLAPLGSVCDVQSGMGLACVFVSENASNLVPVGQTYVSDRSLVPNHCLFGCLFLPAVPLPFPR